MKTSIRTFLVVFFFTSLILSQSISWQQLSGPHGGAIYSLVTDNSGNFYANTVGTPGPFKSTDAGQTWFSIMDGLTPSDNGGFHPMNINSNGDLFIGGAHSTAYLCRSTDGGNSWEPLNNLNTNQGSVICISFDSYNNVYVGTGTGIYKSTDNGDNWSQYGMIGSQTEAIAFNDSGHIFAGTSYAVYRSKDDGANWTQLPTGGGTRTVGVAPNGYVFAGCQENAGILRSTDNGDSWTYVYPQTVSVRFASTVLYLDDNIWFPTYGKGVLHSTDYGDTWTELNNGLGYKYVRAVAASEWNLLAGTDYGIYSFGFYYSYWKSIGLPLCSVKKIVSNIYGYIFTGVWGVNRSVDWGQTWETVNNGIDNYDIRAILVHNSGYIFAGAWPQNWSVNNLYQSTDNGDSWAPVLSFPLNSLVAVTGLALGPNGEIVAVGSGMGSICHISTDIGLTWTDIRYNLTFGPGEVAINSLGDIFIMGGSQGIWRKLANDTVWTQILTGNAGATLFIASNEFIYTTYSKSTDNGNTWVPNGIAASASSYSENSLGHLFAGTYNYGSGVYRSIDFGETWELISDGLPTSININALAVDSEDYLYAGTGGKSMFKTTTSTVVSVEGVGFKTTSFSLEQNYPNPFNPSTAIKWQQPETGVVTLKIYDVLGREVTILLNEELSVGKHETIFDASRYSSGVYFYQIKAGDFIQTKKMILIK